ncbi:hypothetical protein PSQ19_13540 [Devosia algicola]|uniref:Uncharacterized protein n=1 Tax=Devosia algicola TaxID=3026418 RepID=A0ABY7YLA8_9HYPH|nr:hypothetical protein [Devosia algicola]WDR01755.1 hypothetical protein PSQ19_13540 [Devosia algicola]
MDSKLVSALTILTSLVTIIVVCQVLAGPGPALAIGVSGAVAFVLWLWSGGLEKGEINTVLTRYLLLPASLCHSAGRPL